MAFEHIETYNNLGFRIGCKPSAWFPPHFHDEYEIIYIMKGCSQINIGPESFELSEKDCLIIERRLVHTFSAYNDETYALVLNIDPNFCLSFCPEFARMIVHQKIVLPRQYPGFIRELQEFFILYYTILDSTAHKQHYPEHQLLLQSQLTRFCSKFFSEFPDTEISNTDRFQNSSYERLLRMLKYISDNHYRKLTLSELSEQYGLNMYYLSHYIKDTIGMSFQDYLSRIRLDHSIYLINNYPKKTKEEICYEVGFSDSRYLEKAFFKHFNCSVSEYNRNFLSGNSKKAQICEPTVFPFVPRPDEHSFARGIVSMLEMQKI